MVADAAADTVVGSGGAPVADTTPLTERRSQEASGVAPPAGAPAERARSSAGTRGGDDHEGTGESHYQNKIFASATAADAHRAHPRCKCRVEAAFTVDDETYGALFGSSDSADRRTPGVAETLARSTIAPAPTASAVSADPGSSGLALTGAPVLALAAAGAGAAAAGVVMLRSARPRPEQPAEA
jgi:hypothetical protein